MIAGVGYTPNYHNALTGSQADGRAFATGEDKTCHNWTSSAQGAARVGHIDRKGLRDDAASKSVAVRRDATKNAAIGVYGGRGDKYGRQMHRHDTMPIL